MGLLVVIASLLAACGGDDGMVAWRDLELTVPDGWVVFEEEDSRLSLANQAIGADVAEADRPDGDVVAVFLTHRPGVTPGEWRSYIEEVGATLEVDQPIEVGGVPATRLQFLTPGGDGSATTRELVVVVPAREVELLAQPVPLPDDEQAPATFDRALPTFDELLDSVTWGAPLD
ncbi:MAG: hypothetical protein WEB03_00495 [Nitriliruptor sp.]|uniref:hypothetical protein n=1 Tax=Nitriliruptor sp. TaxID=2448056 RepID=UPI0034A05FD9